jgi:hypothetical protein
MRWFDDLWLKEGFATFMAYKAMERIMPERNAWKALSTHEARRLFDGCNERHDADLSGDTELERGEIRLRQYRLSQSAVDAEAGGILLEPDKFQKPCRCFSKNMPTRMRSGLIW